jgi:capsule polysaccharide export protein KpsE/RkpR
MDRSVNEKERSIAEDRISILEIASTLLKHRKEILTITSCCAVLSVIFSVGSLLLPPEKSYLPNLYRTVATMLVNSPDSSGGLSSVLSTAGLSGLAGAAGVSVGGSNYGDLAVYMAKSNTILDAIIDKFALMSLYKVTTSPRAETRAALLKKYSAGFDEKTGILTISYEDFDPVRARDIVNFAMDLIDKRFMSIGGNRNVTKKEQLEAKIADVKIEMTRIEGEIQKFQQKHGIITAESIASEQVSTVAQIRSELIMKEMEIKTYGDVSKVVDPALRRLQAERDNLSKLLDGLEQGYSEYERVLPSQRELSLLVIEFSHLQRDLLVQEKIFELLTQQYELTKLQLTGSDPIIQVLEAGEILDKKTGPSRATLCIESTLAGLLLSILWVFGREAVAKLRANPEVLEKLKASLR